MQSKLLRNIPVFSSLFEQKTQPATNDSLATSPAPTSTNVPVRPSNLIDDGVLFPFSDKISLLLQSLGAEILEKMQHSTSGKDFLLLRLGDNIEATSLRLPKENEFTGEATGMVASYLHTTDGRLLAFAEGFHGEINGFIGRTWEDVAEYINESGSVTPIPLEIVRTTCEVNASPNLDRTLELISSGCSKIGMYSLIARAQDNFVRSNGHSALTQEQKDVVFSEFIEPLTLAAQELSLKRLSDFKILLAPQAQLSNRGLAL